MNKIYLLIILIIVLIFLYSLKSLENNCENNVYNLIFWKKMYGKHQANLLNFIKKIKVYLEKHKIKYWMCGGTLLGSIRHGGFIPWDDDVDFSYIINGKDIFKFIDDLKSNGIIIKRMFFGFKIINPDNENEFIDMFEFHPKLDAYYPNADTLEVWPNEYYSFDQIINISPERFEDIVLPCPGNPKAYCIRAHGDKCFDKFIIQKPHFEEQKNYYNNGLYFCSGKEFDIKKIK